MPIIWKVTGLSQGGLHACMGCLTWFRWRRRKLPDMARLIVEPSLMAVRAVHLQPPACCHGDGCTAISEVGLESDNIKVAAAACVSIVLP